MSKSRHVARVKMTGQLLAEMWGLPDTVEVVTILKDDLMGTFDVLFRAEHLPEVKEGEVPRYVGLGEIFPPKNKEIKEIVDESN
jgi:hypothetical protein